MEIKIKIIEFSSDVFSKSNQLKNLIISPLFANTNFTINIFEAISKNVEYKIKVNTHIIKIGLYNGNSLLGIGEININKKSQKIKICSEDKTKNDNSLLNNSYIKTQENDFFLKIECRVDNSPTNDKYKNLNTKEISFRKKKKNASMDILKYNNKNNDISSNIYNKEKRISNKVIINLKKNNNNDDFFNRTNINYDLTNTTNVNKIKNNSIAYNNFGEGINGIKSNSTIIKPDKKIKLYKNSLFPNLSYKVNKNKNKKNPVNIYNNKEKESYINNIFNLSFQKELFSDGVLILSDNNEVEKENNDLYKNIEVKDFDNLINEFNFIYNNVSNNNTYTPRNIKDNFLLEYQFFLEKTSDIFNLYAKISSEINNQNKIIKKDIQNYNDKIKILIKKSNILKITKQNIDFSQSVELQKNQNLKKYYDDEIINLKNKLSLIKNITKDFLPLINNNYIKQDNSNNSNIKLMAIFKNIINNENNREYVNDYRNTINSLINKKQKIVKNSNDINSNENNNYDHNNEDSSDENNNDGNDTIKNGDNKIDLEALKNKIDKLKIQYLNETTSSNYNEIKGEKMNNYNNLKSISDRGNYIYAPNKKKVNKYLNVHAPKWKTKK
jgi:hypothetical protein